MGLGVNRGMRGPKKINPSSGVSRLLRFEGGKILDFGVCWQRPFLVSHKEMFSAGWEMFSAGWPGALGP